MSEPGECRTLDIEGIGTLELAGDFLTFRVLVLEDDPAARETTQELLEPECEVFLAETTVEADRLVETRSFDAVLADAILTESLAGGGEMQGDRWLHTHVNDRNIRDAIKAVVTAYPRSVGPRDQLDRAGVRVIIKSDDEELEFYESLVRSAQALKRARESAVRDRIAGLTSELVDGQAEPSPLSQEMINLFVRWVDSLPSSGETEMLFRGRDLSAQDLVTEVQERTTIGEDVLRMFVRHLKRLLEGPAEEDLGSRQGNEANH